MSERHLGSVSIFLFQGFALVFQFVKKGDIPMCELVLQFSKRGFVTLQPGIFTWEVNSVDSNRLFLFCFVFSFGHRGLLYEVGAERSTLNQGP